jgi:hypothetical protein
MTLADPTPIRHTEVGRSTLAVMQPYLFPYLGYFQLMAAADKFVLYDDVNYIKQGWVNRNRLLVNGQAHLFTLPVKNASSFMLIRDMELEPQLFGKWRDKFLRLVAQAYSRAPQLAAILAMLDDVMGKPHNRLTDLLLEGIRSSMGHMGLRTELVTSSTIYQNSHLAGQERILDICAQEGARCYVNAIGGKDLYQHDAFAARGIALSFVRGRLPEYKQGKAPFVPGLSVLDVMMFVPQDELSTMLQAYDLE